MVIVVHNALPIDIEAVPYSCISGVAVAERAWNPQLSGRVNQRVPAVLIGGEAAGFVQSRRRRPMSRKPLGKLRNRLCRHRSPDKSRRSVWPAAHDARVCNHVRVQGGRTGLDLLCGNELRDASFGRRISVVAEPDLADRPPPSLPPSIATPSCAVTHVAYRRCRIEGPAPGTLCGTIPAAARPGKAWAGSGLH
jgi:hypothetical protein